MSNVLVPVTSWRGFFVRVNLWAKKALIKNKAGGVTVRVRATCMQKFTDLLEAEGYQVKRVGIETKAYVALANGEGGDDNGGDQPGENNGGVDDLEP